MIWNPQFYLQSNIKLKYSKSRIKLNYLNMENLNLEKINLQSYFFAMVLHSKNKYVFIFFSFKRYLSLSVLHFNNGLVQ